MAVTGGRVTRANRVKSRSDHWEIEVAPDSRRESVTLVLVHNRHCLVVGAICTLDGRRLSNRLEQLVKGPSPAVPERPKATALWSGMVDLEWNDVPRADSYDVQFSRPPQGSSPSQWDDLPNDSIDIAVYGAGAVVKNLPLEPFQFRVRAVNAPGASEWSQDVLVPSTGGPQAWTGVSEPMNSAATGAPTISGTPRILETLRADDAGIADENGLERVKFHYQWTSSDGVDESDIDGATGSSYSLTADDVGRNIRVRVSFVDRHGFEESLSSDPDGLVVNTPATGAPTITGTARVGETLSADTSGIADENGLGNATFSYQWVRNDRTRDTNTQDGTDLTYTLTWDDEGTNVKVRVNFTDDVDSEESVTSAATEAVEAAVGEVGLSGELRAGRDSSKVPAVSGYSIYGDLGGTLAPDRFEFDGNTYRVLFLVHSSEGLWLSMTRDLPVDFALRVGDAAYRGSESMTPVTITGTGAYWWPSTPPDWLGDDPAQVSLTLYPAIPLTDHPKAPVAGYFRDTPTEHDGNEDISFRVVLSEGVATTADALRDHVLAVSGGKVSRVDGVDSGGRIWAISVTPGAWAPITIRIAADLDCDLPEAICTGDNRRLFNPMTMVVPAKLNHPPTGTPTISGEVEVGKTLTVDTSGISDADGLTDVTFSYQWVSSTWNRDTDIQGATGPTYTLVPADAGNAIKVRVSFRDDAGKTETLTSPPRTERPHALSAAASDGAVVLTWELPARWPYSNYYYILRSRPELGEIEPLVRVARPTSGQTTYTDTDVEPGVLYVYRVRGADFVGEPRDASDPVEIRIPEPTPVENSPASGAPAIGGAVQVGETLSVDTSGIADADGLSGTAFIYQWVSNDGDAETDIQGATGATYTVTSNDDGKSIKVKVSFTDEAGNAESLTSAATAVVEPKPNSPASGAPTIGGAVQVGETLSVDTSGIADADGLSGTAFIYQWVSNDGDAETDIQGATGATYTVTSNDDGKSIKVKVSFTDEAGNAESLTSAATAVVEPKPNSPASGAPTIGGAVQVGETLSVDTSGIADADGLSGTAFIYQWVSNDGDAETDIQGATGATYTVTSNDDGKSIKVKVSFTDEAGNAESLTSAATVAVVPRPPLTASFQSKPSTHDGQTAFTFELHFSEEFGISYQTLRDHAFTVTGGAVAKARRLTQGSNIGWQITVTPNSGADVTVVLPVTTDCTASGAICTGDGRKLSNRNEFTVSGTGQ